MAAPEPFNPLSLEALEWSFSEALKSKRLVRLSEVRPFKGAGLYLLYYDGALRYYAPIRLKRGVELPLYVGSAMPKGMRKGKAASGEGDARLFDRINKHRTSIASTADLKLRHFYCRWIVVDPPFIGLGEWLLVKKYAPLWNQVLEGFGANVVGGPRTGGARSKWDTLHAGRPGRGSGKGKYRREEVLAEIAAHLAQQAVSAGATRTGVKPPVSSKRHPTVKKAQHVSRRKPQAKVR